MTQVSTVATAAAALAAEASFTLESGPAFRRWTESTASYLLLPASVPLLLTSAAQVDNTALAHTAFHKAVTSVSQSSGGEKGK